MTDTEAGSTAPDAGGLTSDEAARRLSADGPNRLSGGPRRGLGHVVRDVMREPMFLLLLAAVGVYALLGDLAEAGFLLVGALATIGLVILQEARSERALAALKALEDPTARVRRDGEWRQTPAAEIVRGDRVLIGEGGRIPADGRIASGDVLSVDESVLTGESAPVTRTHADAGDPAIFRGTLVVSGVAVMTVEATGDRTRLGGIGSALSQIGEPPTALQRSSSRLVFTLGVAAIVLAVATVLAYGLVGKGWLEGAIAGLTLAIAMIPEEFPMILAVFMALGAWRLARLQVLVRRTAAIEALGAVSVLCVDKTGTLTANRMAVAALWARDGGRMAPDAPKGEALLRAAAGASAVHAIDAMDLAVKAAVSGGPAGRPVRSYPLTPRRLAFIQLWAEGHAVRADAKGAPEAIFDLSSLADTERRDALAVLDQMAAEGLRVLGVARADDVQGDPEDPGDIAFTFLGLIGFEDPVRAEVPAALATAAAAGVKVVMITGDFPQTALAVARDAGIDTAAGVVTGAQMAGMDEAALMDVARLARVFARISPEQKLRLVRAFQALGERVGMFGDGVNDAPALQAAEVGVAMGKRGVDVAREASDIVLLDDRFASVIDGIREGRRIFANLQAALAYVVVVHVPMAGLALLPPLLGLPPVIFPMQVVLLELLIDPMCALAFEARPAAADAMRRPPRLRATAVMSRAALARALVLGLLLLSGPLFAHWSLLAEGAPAAEARGAALTALICANLATAALLGWERGSRRTAELLFAVIATGGVGALAAALYMPGLASLFGIAAPPPQILMAIGVGSLALGAIVGGLGRWSLGRRERATPGHPG